MSHSANCVKGDGSLGEARDRIDGTRARAWTRRGYRVRLRRDLGEPGRDIAHGHARGCDALARPHMLQTVDDDEFVRGKPTRHHAQAVDFGPEFDETVLDTIIAGQGQHVLLGKIRTDGAVLDEDAVTIFAA